MTRGLLRGVLLGYVLGSIVSSVAWWRFASAEDARLWYRLRHPVTAHCMADYLIGAIVAFALVAGIYLGPARIHDQPL